MIQLIGLVCAVVSLFLGWTVFLNDRKVKTNMYYLAFSISSTVWLLSNVLSTPGPLKVGAFIEHYSAALISISSVASLIFLNFFSSNFTGRTLSRFIKILFIGQLLLLAATAFTSLNVTYDNGKAEVGSLYPVVVTLQIIDLLILVLPLFFIKRRNQIEKRNSIFMRNTLIISLTPIFILGSILPLFGYETLSNIAPAFSVLFLGIFAYSMKNHRLFDIRAAVARATAYTFSISLITIIFAAVFYILFRFIGLFVVSSNSQSVIYAISAVLVATQFATIKKFFDRVTNQLFFKDRYDPQEFIDDLTGKIARHVELKSLLDACTKSIQSALKPENMAFGIQISERTGDIYVHATQKSFMQKNNLTEISHTFKIEKETIIVVEGNNSLSAKSINLLTRNGIAVLVQLASSSKEVGFLALSDKKSGDAYNEQDVKVLDIISDEMAVAIENALRFNEIEEFNVTLQGKVDDATKQLRHTNEKLKALDETKDEFISMASHQLRTPLTSVKGYVSMVLDGDAGPLNEQQNKLLRQAFTSSQRMNYLISDLLNVSRLRTGKFVIETQQTNLAEVVQSEVEQLTETANARGLELKFEMPKDFPTLELDETKTRQVIMNFIDNAIYYTPAGGKIIVELEANEQRIELRVVDNGLGVPKKDQHQLFSKFYRADNAKRARPDGTGLGLFMAKKVIIAQGGAVIFNSQEGKGSTFGFTFPRVNKEAIKQAEA